MQTVNYLSQKQTPPDILHKWCAGSRQQGGRWEWMGSSQTLLVLLPLGLVPKHFSVQGLSASPSLLWASDWSSDAWQDADSCWSLSLQKCGFISFSMVMFLWWLPCSRLITPSGVDGNFSLRQTWPKPYYPPCPQLCASRQKVLLLHQCIYKRQFWVTA